MNYHFVWTPKYRRKVIVGDVEKRLKSLLKEKCNQLNIEIISLETMPDHVHIFVRLQPTIAPNRIAACIKGIHIKDTKTRVFRVKVQTSYVME